MERKTTTDMLLGVFLMGMLMLAFDIQPVKAEPKTWIVDDDGPANFSTIKEAINAANPGETIYVKAGTYNEDITIDKPLALVGEGSDTTTIHGSGNREVVIVNANNVNLSGFTVKGRGGLWGGWTGIWILDGVSGVNISNNIVLFHGIAIELEEYTSGITIQSNNISNSLFGIDLYFSTNNIIKSNIITSNGYGIDVWYSNNNIIINNLITNHLGWPRYAIELLISNDTIIQGNTISNNYRGISVKGSSNNKIYHNNFLDNADQVIIWKTYRDGIEIKSYNVWDDGYPSGGNYWSDYTGVDLYSGPYQNETGSDGIGDRPYVIDANNRDRYPLMNPFVAPPPGVHDIAIINVVPSATEVYVGQVVNITVTVQNQGNFTETFTVTCKYELKGTEHIIDAITVNNLAPQANASIVFTWTTTDVTVHTIKAEIPPLPDETDTADNTLTSPTTVKVKLLGDVNGDDKIDMKDIAIAALAFGSYPTHPRWNSICDLNGDNKIDLKDIGTVARNFGKKHP